MPRPKKPLPPVDMDAPAKHHKPAWSADLEARLLGYLRSGQYVEVACRLAGVHETTLYRRLAKARELQEIALGEGEIPELPANLWQELEFLARCEEAMAAAEASFLAIIDKAANGWTQTTVRQEINPRTGEIETLTETRNEFAWQAAAWRLERMYPARWGRRKPEDDNDNQPGVHVQIYVPDNQRGGQQTLTLDAGDPPAPGSAGSLPV